MGLVINSDDVIMDRLGGNLILKSLFTVWRVYSSRFYAVSSSFVKNRVVRTVKNIWALISSHFKVVLEFELISTSTKGKSSFFIRKSWWYIVSTWITWLFLFIHQTSSLSKSKRCTLFFQRWRCTIKPRIVCFHFYKPPWFRKTPFLFWRWFRKLIHFHFHRSYSYPTLAE